jgi:hypothetical protein
MENIFQEVEDVEVYIDDRCLLQLIGRTHGTALQNLDIIAR